MNNNAYQQVFYIMELCFKVSLLKKSQMLQHLRCFKLNIMQTFQAQIPLKETIW